MVISIERTPKGRRVRELIVVEGMANTATNPVAAKSGNARRHDRNGGRGGFSAASAGRNDDDAWICEPRQPAVCVGQRVAPGRVGSFVACEAIERLKQRVDDRLAERLCCLADLGFVCVADGGGEFRGLIGQDRIGPIYRPLREIVPAVDDPGFHQCELPRLAFV